ncbi:NAD(P)/FAD-dependent oxidoreductase [Stakelama pacifica]|uniref:D-amino-acid dehydrogenase n=1 Tax=Stakelama pacifica TaxID=517720 RepID=A0A4R6FD84_9SPHN|nr:FAD-binding oxidoreductase [Stakelama pacifica]TDN78254.1 D-amino-acid dehydrogenase [Stakelama pacifica]GGO99794.1 cytochrome c4 [Stakelama pacifica]
MRSVSVIGGGIVGLSIALAAQTRGFAVTLVDAGLDKPASWGNAGHIAVEQVEPLASFSVLRNLPRRLLSSGGGLALPLGSIAAWAPFGLRLVRAALPARYAAGRVALTDLLREAMPAWRRLVLQLGDPDLLRQDGHFIIWETPQSARSGLQRWQTSDVDTAFARPASASEFDLLSQLVTKPISGAVRVEGSGQIADLTRLAALLRSTFRGCGGTIIEGQAHSISQVGHQCVVRVEAGTLLASDFAVIAAGYGSKALLASTGLNVPMIAERGYHLQSAGSGWPSSLPPLVFEDRALIVTRFDKQLRAASFVEFAKAEAPPNPARWRRILSHIEQLGLPIEQPLERWVGSRPTLPDYLPAIGRSNAHPSFFYAFGHQHLGLTLGPLTGELIAALLAGDEPAVSLEPFDLARFH